MPGRGRKPSVQPEKYWDWLRRSEGGESAPRIAKADRFDVRTVRKYLELARQEREIKDARSTVLRQALEKHYADLVDFANKLRDQVILPTEFPLRGKGERLYLALQQHLPRSPLWRDLKTWDRLHEQRLNLGTSAAARMITEVEDRGPLKFATRGQPKGFQRDGLSSLVALRLEAVGKGHERPPAPWGIDYKPVGTEGLVQVICNSRICALVSRDKQEEAASFIEGLMDNIPAWPEAEAMGRTLSEIHEVTDAITEELATIMLRRVVPGRCKYCPF